MKTIQLANEDSLPSVGLGFWKIDRDRTAEVAAEAVRLGYRHLDCAADYGNESEVGAGIERVLNDRICQRDALWVTSKLWNTYHRPAHVAQACRRSLKDLRIDHLDLYLIHFPIALAYVPFDVRYPAGWFFDPSGSPPRMVPDPVPIAETWGAMERLVEEGLVRHIGVSNFGVSLLRDLLSYCTIRPSVLQVESHPYLVQAKLLRYCQSEQIAMTAFSPLGAPSYIPLGMATSADSVMGHPAIVEIAMSTGRSAAQVILRWGVQRGTSVIPKSSSAAHLSENLNLFDFALSDSQMAAIDTLDRNQRFNDPGVFCEQAFGCFFPIYE
ncbi:MAG: aldo/keto reductase [Planctomycetota bacterium]|jgi:D-xylose reductase